MRTMPVGYFRRDTAAEGNNDRATGQDSSEGRTALTALRASLSKVTSLANRVSGQAIQNYQ